MKKCSEATYIVVEENIKENPKTGEIEFKDGCEIPYRVGKVFDELRDEVIKIIEDAIKNSGYV